VADEDPRTDALTAALVSESTRIIRTSGCEGLVALVDRERPQLLLLDVTTVEPSAEERANLVDQLTPLAPLVVMGEDEDQDLRLWYITRGAQDYVTRDTMFGDHLLWTVIGSYGRWSFERALALRNVERAAIEQRLDLARDLHDEAIQRLFVCRLQLDSVGPEADAVGRELAEIIAHLRSTIGYLIGSGASVLDELHQLCEHHTAAGQQVDLTTSGELVDISEHVRLNLLDAAVTLLTMCVASNTDIRLELEANEHHIELQAHFLTERSSPGLEARIDLGRLTNAASKMGGLMGWTWTHGLARVRWSVPTTSTLRMG
ncbi:MAG: histidine kinase, partial [Acidimicrobiia bacterium]|nr:histidine kinase [Acidimicrobiia bacterium]